MHKDLETDRDLSEMRNAGSPLEVMLERAFFLGLTSGGQGANSLAKPKSEPKSETAKAFAEAVAKRAEARKKG